jgi:hypothetical protein
VNSFFGYHSAAMTKWRIFLLLGLLLLTLNLDISPSAAQTSDPYAVIAAVNAFRTSNGLPALQIDSSLMAAAQAQSDYQASISTVTHKGAGGTSATDRAIAYGFGGGAQAFVSENIAGGLYLTIDDAIYKYWQDDLHLQTMLNPASLFIGAGVAITASGYAYYTVDTGYYSGAQAPVTTDGTPLPTTVPLPTNTSGPAIDPFIVSTPRPDGAIIHVIGYGQTLAGIANTYDVIVGELLLLNNMELNSVIYPGDEIIIRESYTPTVTESATTPAPSITASITPTSEQALEKIILTPKQSLTASPTLTLSPTLSPTPIVIPPEREPVVVGTVLVSLLVLLGVIVSGLIKGKSSQE